MLPKEALAGTSQAKPSFGVTSLYGSPGIVQSSFWIHVSHTNGGLNPPLRQSDRRGSTFRPIMKPWLQSSQKKACLWWCQPSLLLVCQQQRSKDLFLHDTTHIDEPLYLKDLSNKSFLNIYHKGKKNCFVLPFLGIILSCKIQLSL